MNINSKVLDALDEYHEKSLLMQKVLYDKDVKMSLEELRLKVDDDLIFHVPIYDMLDRKYAAFSSFPEAVVKKSSDPKGNGERFKHVEINDDNFIAMLYLFRLCGSGINYVPKTHGFGNFWIVDLVEKGFVDKYYWVRNCPESKFSNNKGYLLPQFNIGLRVFIQLHSLFIIDKIVNFISSEIKTIKQVVDYGNSILNSLGFKKQTFVLSAFAADLAEYFPSMVDPNSMIYAGTNAKKCIKAIFGRCREEEAIWFLSKRYNATPYSVEDSRLCDPVRYFLEYQSRFHIESNNGNIYNNNTLLKKQWNKEEYQSFLLQLQK